MAKINHVFVLMLENRSFDHLFGLSGLPGVPKPPAKFGFKPGAPDQLTSDPPHEFDDVAVQIDSGAMDGFGKSGGPDVLKGFSQADIPVLVKLANDSLLMDNWFSSMPGPTWPNRFFVHAASSGGLDNSMGTFDVIKAVTNPGFCLRFQYGHVFDRLSGRGVPWRIYHGDSFPQVLSLKGMVAKKSDATFFRPASDFASDMARGDTVAYTFIEPDYDLFRSYRYGNSHHPLGKISTGETFIAYIYNAIFKQNAGKSSVLVVTWDEHGGFFDHVVPPPATPPGDSPLNHLRAKKPRNCRFDRFGVRVPTLLISPWLPAGLGSRVFGPNTAFDHSSVVRALRSTFSLGAELTLRDLASPDWNQVLLEKPRALSVELPEVMAPQFDARPPSLEEISAEGSPSGNVLGTAQIAVDLDWYIAERIHKAPLITSEFEARLLPVQAVLTRQDSPHSSALVDDGEAHRVLLQYIAAVRSREIEFQETRNPP
ncbi:hypothetical protein A9K65_013810 [Mesorhizobium sp. WSM1497]|uniref:alkaline phosphatase family protein n=1 Tax=Mesorhizobium sp. WSM1497 TaxID=278153 RepID=UPI0007EE19AA|nr:alkaline phosphatase family protein [Mesorhizobium sp. WSM1497]ARP64337.1 hypothetical protein A9K65_013810 [Mesorhizobium sp. WSM1497]